MAGLPSERCFYCGLPCRTEIKPSIPMDARELIFEEALRDREIDWQSPDTAEETTPPVQEM